MTDNYLSEQIKNYRLKKGYSQEALAEIAGVSVRTIQRIEKENKKPSGDTIKRLSAALGVSPDELLDWQPNENSNFLLLLVLSPLLFLLEPIFAIIVPLFLWIWKKESIKGVKKLGLKILTIQLIWIVAYYLFMFINFFLFKNKINNGESGYTHNEFDNLMLGFERPLFLSYIFIAVNIILIAILAYKVYSKNKTQLSN